MREFFTNGLHIFVIVIMLGFVIFGIMALAGKFDHWDSRFIKKAQQIFSRLRRYFDRNRKREQIQQQDNYEDTRHDHHALHETHSNSEDVK